MGVGESFDFEKSLYRVSVGGFSFICFYQVDAGQTIELVHVAFTKPELHIEMTIVGHNVIILQHFLNYLSVLCRKLNLIAEPVEESDTSGVVSSEGSFFKTFVYSCM